MKRNVVFAVSAIYMFILGVGFILVPKQIGIDAVPGDASNALIGYLRVFGSTFVAIGAMNWMARKAEDSSALNVIIMTNVIGFGLAAILDLWASVDGGRSLAMIFAAVHLLFTLAFVSTRRSTSSMQVRQA
jgi:hypothetical protein